MAIAAAALAPSRFDEVTGNLTYLVDTGVKPVSYNYDPPPGVPRRSGTYVDHRQIVFNGRRAHESFVLDRQGFELRDHRTAVKDFYDEAEVTSVYYAEVEALLKRATGAEKIVTFDHTLRVGQAKNGNAYREPVHRVHNDYTVKSGPQRLRALLEPAEAEERIKNRFAIVNVWRSIRGPVEEAPLALCDARSVRSADLIVTDLLYPDRVGEIYSVAYNPAQRWVYFPDMTRNEALLLKVYDSMTDGRARFAPHSAFDDPSGPRHPAPRESIETRSLLLFPPEG